MRAKITKTSVDALEPGEIIADTEVKGFVARRLRSGVITYGLRYRANGKQRWLALGLHGAEITAEKARTLAKKRVGEVADDRDPAAERRAARSQVKRDGADTVSALLDAFLERHVRRNLRSAKDVERILNKYVRPRIGTKGVSAVRRADIIAMLDAIEDEHGPVMADQVLAHLRKAFNWHAARDDNFAPPIVRGMARTRPRERARKRSLADDEIRDLWVALDAAKAPAAFPRFIRALLLTAQRRDEVADMSWQEVDVRARIWVIPSSRRKGGENVVPLTGEVLKLLGKPKKKGFVFSTTDGTTAFSGFSKCKKALDATILAHRKKERRAPMPPWVLHDLRRTARSLMSRAGVSVDIAERVLGHVIPGVRGVYDRYGFFKEKKEALEKLSLLVREIVETDDLATGSRREKPRLPKKRIK